ncbi:hypothetical protein HID58_044568 [Brassica napus]|uniref:DUF287 domain-containing protein n=1 Tax=Brassica napus TaxID=3708 RepID=A0ABQ8BLD0_BRANA|nr:hypothetical protein HID58_044568 [Brassica napus]
MARGRPRKAEKPHKFTTPLPTKRIRAPSQYIMTKPKRGGKKNTKQKKGKSTKKNIAHVEEQHVEELSTGNDRDDLSAHENETDHPAQENETDHLSATSQVIKSVLAPTIDKETLMARIMEDEPDYENEDGPSNLWSSWLTVKEKPIWWKDLYELDVAARKFPTKKDKMKVNEEASSSNASLEDVLKGIEERLMTCLSEVSVKVETMNKRLCVMEKSQVVLKRRSKRMKAMEKRLEDIENCQYHLKKNGRKQKAMVERIDALEKEMKRKENENVEGFDYQNMDFDWDGGRSVDAEMVEEPEGQKAEETDKEEEKEEAEIEKKGKDGEEEAQKENTSSEEEKELEVQVEEDKEAEEEKEQEVETENKEGEAAQTQAEDDEEKGEEEVEKEGENTAETEPPVEVEEEVQKKIEEEGEENVENEHLAEVEEEVQNENEEELNEGKEVEEEPEQKEAELDEGKEVEEEPEQTEKVEKEDRIYTEEEKKRWILTVCKTDDVPPVEKTGGTEETSRTPARGGVKHRPKLMAVRKHATKKRGRPRKAEKPHKFTTPLPTKRIRAPSQYVTTPFTEANTDEIEGRKKKPKTKA